MPRPSFQAATSSMSRPGLRGTDRPLLDGHSNPLLEFGSGNLAAKAAGQDLPQLAMSPATQLNPYSSLGAHHPCLFMCLWHTLVIDCPALAISSGKALTRSVQVSIVPNDIFKAQYMAAQTTRFGCLHHLRSLYFMQCLVQQLGFKVYP